MAHMQDGFPILSDDEMTWVAIHGWLMGISWGIVAPLAVLLIRGSKFLDANVLPSHVEALFHMHVSFQLVAILMAIYGVGFLFMFLGATLDHTHQRLGMAVMCMMCSVPFTSFIHPHRESRLRIFVHRLFGTGAWILGAINIFLGMRLYENLWRTSLLAHYIGFSILLAVFCFLYLMQEMSHLRGPHIHGPQRTPHVRIH